MRLPQRTSSICWKNVFRSSAAKQIFGANKRKDCDILKVDFRDIINNDFEGFLDILSENLIGNPCLMGIDYKIVGYEDDSLLRIKVTGMVELED